MTQTDELSDIQTIKEDNTKRVAEQSHGEIEIDCTHSLDELSGNYTDSRLAKYTLNDINAIDHSRPTHVISSIKHASDNSTIVSEHALETDTIVKQYIDDHRPIYSIDVTGIHTEGHLDDNTILTHS